MEAPNVLLLDEPTNDLDLETMGILESFIDDFNGAIIFVSHDRYFVNKLADCILEFENGKVTFYNKNYQEFLEYKENQVYETGYLLKKEYWHKGYAIESAKACKDYAFNVLHADEVYSIIRINNAPSIKVAIKNGMTLKDTIIKHYYNMDMPHNVYSITKEKYEKI